MKFSVVFPNVGVVSFSYYTDTIERTSAVDVREKFKENTYRNSLPAVGVVGTDHSWKSKLPVLTQSGVRKRCCSLNMNARNLVSPAITLFTTVKYGFLGVKVTNVFCVCRCLKLQIGCVKRNIMHDKTEYEWKATFGGGLL
jgi:hypothetical protein